MPSTSAGAIPASAHAAKTASTAKRISLRPECFENSVAPMPTIAVLPLIVLSLILCLLCKPHRTDVETTSQNNVAKLFLSFYAEMITAVFNAYLIKTGSNSANVTSSSHRVIVSFTFSPMRTCSGVLLMKPAIIRVPSSS